MKRRAWLAASSRALALALACAASVPGQAQSYPNRTITVAYQFGPGAFDVMLRALCAEAGTILGQPVVLENRPGGNGRVMLNVLRSAKPDGYTLGLAINGTLVHLPLADPSFKLDVQKDYVPVAHVIDSPQVLTANPAVPFKDIRGMVAYAKSNPGKLNMSVNLGGASHFIGELMKYTAAVDITSVPYKSSQAGMTDLVDGRVQLAISSGSAKSFVDSGKLVALATTAKERWKAFPNAPTFTEAGLPIASTVWFALIAAPGTPREVVSTLNRAFNEALKRPNIRGLYEAEFYNASPMTPEQLTSLIRDEVRTWEPVIKKAGIRME